MCKYCEKEQRIYNEKSNSGLVIKNNRLIIYKKEEEKNKIISKIKISNCPFCGNDLYDGNQKEYTFEIDSKLPSLNDYLHVCKHSQGYSGTFKRNTDDIIGWELKRQNVDKLRIAKPIKGYITYIEPLRNRDVDNVYSASKYIFDGLQKMNVIENDNPTHLVDVKSNVVYDKNCKNGKVLVRLVEV
ncbi:MAG: hypothetical protein IJJ82_05185 [Clostridia bacterium]|nr:hypothetical protein [Clostridia bacterium]